MKLKMMILVGIPGCGKSTWAETWFSNIVSSDSIREELSNRQDQSKNGQVFEIFHKRIENSLAGGSSVCADSTALDSGARKQLRDIAAKYDAETHVVFFANPSQAVTRNATRPIPVPWEAMERMISKYEKSLTDIQHEKYTSITYIKEVQ